MRPDTTPYIDLDERLVARDAHVHRIPSGPIRLGARMGRRAFLEGLGLSGVVSLSGCERLAVEHALPLLTADEDSRPGAFVRYASTCLSCPAACGMLVTVRDGRPIKLEGQPEHPLSKGGLCALGQASVRGLYDAGRLKKPTLDGEDSEWKALDEHVAARLAAARGRIAVLTPPMVSPTTRSVLESFVERHRGRWVEHDPGLGSAAGVLEAYRWLDGSPRFPAVRIERADVLVTIGGDLLATGPEAVAMTRAYADRRRARKGGRDFRHIHLEGSLSLSGAASDVRVQVDAGERTAFAAQLLSIIAHKSSASADDDVRALLATLPFLQSHAQKVAALADELWEARGRALVVSGSREPREQLVVALLNRVLGAEEATLSLEEPSRTQRGTDAELYRLLDDVTSGAVAALFIVDLNPVEQLPGGEALAKRLAEMALSVAVVSRPTATAAACKVVAAAHHELERWSDAAPRTGTLSLAQPTIRALFDTRDPLESFLVWSGASETSPRLRLMAEWGASLGLGGAEMEQLFSRSLSEGVVTTSVAKAIVSEAREAGRVQPPAAGAPDPVAVRAAMASIAPSEPLPLEVELIEEIGPRDGRAAFNPWLRELPDPLTRASWAAVVRLAPSLANERGIQDGDLVRVTVGEASVEMQARIVPGQHPRVLGVPVGHGVKDGDGAEAKRNGYRLASFGAEGMKTAGLAASLERMGPGEKLPLMQWEASTHDRPIIHQVESHAEKIEAHHEGRSLWGGERTYSPDWHMVIDLDACIGCGACVTACQAENNLPVVGPRNMIDHRDMHWLRIDRYFVGSPDDPEVLFEPMLCAQCDNAPCETVCPVAATVHSHDGLNMQAYNRCVGTRYCANNCPYKVRRFNWFDFTPKDPLERMVLNPDVVVRDRGTMEKCTFCVQRIQLARIETKIGGSPQPVTTACQQSCPAQAITFGDRLTDARVTEALAEPRAFQVLADLGVRPSITYLARVRRRSSEPRGDGS